MFILSCVLVGDCRRTGLGVLRNLSIADAEVHDFYFSIPGIRQKFQGILDDLGCQRLVCPRYKNAPRECPQITMQLNSAVPLRLAPGIWDLQVAWCPMYVCGNALPNVDLELPSFEGEAYGGVLLDCVEMNSADETGSNSSDNYCAGAFSDADGLDFGAASDAGVVSNNLFPPEDAVSHGIAIAQTLDWHFHERRVKAKKLQNNIAFCTNFVRVSAIS